MWRLVAAFDPIGTEPPAAVLKDTSLDDAADAKAAERLTTDSNVGADVSAISESFSSSSSSSDGIGSGSGVGCGLRVCGDRMVEGVVAGDRSDGATDGATIGEVG